MKANEVILGKNLRTFVMELLEKQDKFPKLIDYLISLWTVLEKHKETKQVDFGLIAQILEEAFETPPKKINWDLERDYAKRIKNSKDLPYYEIVTRKLREQLIELHSFRGFFKKPDPQWMNLDVASYLERGTIDYESDDEVFEVDWSELNSIIHEGKYNE